MSGTTFNQSSVPPVSGSWNRGWSSNGVQANFAPPNELSTIPSQSGSLEVISGATSGPEGGPYARPGAGYSASLGGSPLGGA
jgi:hypothetical protein